jgi:hypothetical protein
MEKQRHPIDEKWIELNELAKQRGRCRRTAREWCNGGLKHSKIGNTILIHLDDWDEFVRSRARGGNLSGRR